MRTKEIRAIALMLMLPLLMLTACSSSSDSSDVVVPEPDKPVVQQRPIGFSGIFADSDGGTTSAPTTRGVGDGEFTDTELQASGFGVFCWYTGSDSYTDGSDIKSITKDILMLNQHVTYNNSTGQWTYSPSKYWPLNEAEKLTFRAYAPYVSYQLQTDANGMPWLPVVVTKYDYHNGTQHDPLWGTGRLVQGVSDPVPGEYAAGTTYGQHYDNITYEMSGDNRLKTTLPADTRNGFIDWYFHHGMAKLMFTCSVIKDPGCDKVTINSITIEHIYTQGLLSLSSPTTQATDKPKWDETSLDGNETVILGASELASNPFEITTSSSEPSGPIDLLSTEKGLLVIPRDYTLPDGLTITIKYSVDTDPTELQASRTIHPKIEGNTCYTLNLSLTPSTKGLEISLVQSAFSTWNNGGVLYSEVYNW